MKAFFRVILLFFICLYVSNAQVRIRNPRETAERSVENRANNRVDQGVDRGLDKVEEGIGNIFKKKDKKKKTNGTDAEAETPESAEEGETGETEAKPSSAGKAGAKGGKPAAGGPASPSFKTYSKFDFVAGEKVLAFDDFSTTSIGDFPLGWNTNSSAELVTVEGNPNKWLFMSKDGFFQPEYVKDMPENFTLEFDVLTRYNSNNLLNYSFYITAVTGNVKQDLANKYIQNGIYFDWRPCSGSAGYIVYENSEGISKNDGLNIAQFTSNDCEKPVIAKISIWRQKSRLRMYVNENKILDIPQAFDAKLKYNVFKFASFYMNYATADNQDEFMISNVRYAVGAPDMRSKLITDGKLVTRGITFDVGSDKIKPESYGVLKEIAQVLSENPAVKVKIIGHTDSDGNAASNLELSKKRAAAVSKALASDFKIDASRIQTDGKGAAEPSEPNTTPKGKANNRRVEFVKL